MFFTDENLINNVLDPFKSRESNDIPSFISENIFGQRITEEKNTLASFIQKSESTNSWVNDNLYLNKYCFKFNPSLHKEETTRKEDTIQNYFEKKNIFVVHKQKYKNLFTLCKKRKRAMNEKNEEIRNKKKYEGSRQDNDRTKFIRKVLNIYWYKKIVDATNQNSENHIKKFAEKFIYKISKVENKEYLDMTLKDFYEKKELYQLCEPKIIKSHFEHNIKIIEALKDNPTIDNLLSKKYEDLIREYMDSTEYKKYTETLYGYKGKKFQYFVKNFISNSKSKK